LEEKEKGTEAYKKKDFETALRHYSKAIEIEPEDMVHPLNRAAVYLETGKNDECVKDCMTPLTLDVENMLTTNSLPEHLHEWEMLI